MEARISPIKHTWQLFIDEFIATGDHISAYSRAYPTATRHTAATKGKALLKRPIIADAINVVQQEKRRRMEELRGGYLSERQQQSVIAEVELDLLLSRIARGEIRTPKAIAGRGGQSVEVMVAPDFSDRISAIDKLYRRYGSYIQDRPNPVPANPYAGMTDQQLKAELQKNMELLCDDDPVFTAMFKKNGS